MPKCGVCGWSFSDRTLTKHAETPCGEESTMEELFKPAWGALLIGAENSWQVLSVEEEASE